MLTTARGQVTGERTRAANASTALPRTVELGVDARRTLTATTITTIAAWRTPTCTTTSTTSTRAVCHAEAIRLARRIRALDTELAANHAALTATVTAQTPELTRPPAASRSPTRGTFRLAEVRCRGRGGRGLSHRPSGSGRSWFARAARPESSWTWVRNRAAGGWAAARP